MPQVASRGEAIAARGGVRSLGPGAAGQPAPSTVLIEVTARTSRTSVK